MASFPVWLRGFEAYAGWVFGLSLLLFVGTIILVPIAVVRMDADHFVRRAASPARLRGSIRIPWLVTRVLKNGVGLGLLLAGLAMLVLPGQGIVTILIGIGLLDFPGKRGLERWIVSKPGIQRVLNWIRTRRGRPPFVFSGGRGTEEPGREPRPPAGSTGEPGPSV